MIISNTYLKIKITTILLLLSMLLFSQTTIIVVVKNNIGNDNSIKEIDSISFYNKKNKYFFKDLKSEKGEYVFKNIIPGNYKFEIYNKEYLPFVSINEEKISYASYQKYTFKLYVDSEYPIFPGGEIAFTDYVRNNIDTSIIFKNIKEDTNLYIWYTVDSTGKVGSIIVENCKSVLVINEIERVFNLMPIWTPAKIRKSPVSIRLKYPYKILMHD